MFWSCSLTTLHSSAILVRQALLVAAPTDPGTKKAESFSTQLLQNFWSKLKNKNPKIVGMSPTVSTKCFKQRRVVWHQHHSCLAMAEHQILDGKHFLILGPETGKIWWLKKVQYISTKKYHCQCTSCVARNASGFFTISREQEWFQFKRLGVGNMP